LLDDPISRPSEGRLVIRLLTCSICLLLSVAPLIGHVPAGTVIVTNMSDATATLVDAATQQVVATLPTGAGPHEVATSANGRWAVATNYGNREGAGSTLACS
jgi:YVTN family beta-propeller protein